MMFDWLSYANRIRQESQENWDDVQLTYSVPLYLSKSDYAQGLPALERLFRHLKSGFKGILIYGRPGCGKSHLIRSLTSRLVDDLLFELENTTNWNPDSRVIIPIPIRLNRFDSNKYSEQAEPAFLSLLRRRLEPDFRQTYDLEALLRIGAKFVFLIDDLDEVSAVNLNKNLDDIREGIDKLWQFASVSILLAGRESITNQFRNRFHAIEIQNLEEDSIRNLFEQVTDIQNSNELYEYISKPEGLLRFLSTPYFAIMAASFWDSPGEKDTNLGRLMFSVLDRFIYRQEKTEVVGSMVTERVRKLEQIAMECLINDRPLSRSHISKAGNNLEWFRIMDFITSSPMSPEFTNKWIQAFFAANYFTDEEVYPSNNRRSQISEIINPITSTKMAFLQIFQDLVQEDFSDLISTKNDIIELFTSREIEWYTWGFEQKMAAYYKEELSFDTVITPYKRPYLGDLEVDIYAEKQKGQKKEIEVIECKFRFPPYPKPAQIEYLNQLHNTWALVNKELQEHTRKHGGQVKVSPVLITNSD